MADWSDYKREEREPESKITGKQRCVITAVEEKTSKASGLPMIEITVRPSGCRFTVKSWLVHNEHFNRNATQFFDAFPEIGEQFDFLTWVGCEGAAMFAEDENGYLKVRYWIDAVRAESLPPFEGEKPERQTVTKLVDVEPDDDDLPFM